MQRAQTSPAGLDAVIDRARRRAAETGELRPTGRRLSSLAVPDDLAEFAQRVLTDGTYARTVERIAADDPDLADA